MKKGKVNKVKTNIAFEKLVEQQGLPDRSRSTGHRTAGELVYFYLFSLKFDFLSKVLFFVNGKRFFGEFGFDPLNKRKSIETGC